MDPPVGIQDAHRDNLPFPQTDDDPLVGDLGIVGCLRFSEVNRKNVTLGIVRDVGLLEKFTLRHALR